MRTCQTCASNGGYSFCAAGSPCFPCYLDGDCSHWSSQSDVTITGIMPDGSVQEVTPDQLYAAYEQRNTAPDQRNAAPDQRYAAPDGWQVQLARYYAVLVVLLAAVTVAAGIVHVSCTILCQEEEVTNK